MVIVTIHHQRLWWMPRHLSSARLNHLNHLSEAVQPDVVTTSAYLYIERGFLTDPLQTPCLLRPYLSDIAPNIWYFLVIYTWGMSLIIWPLKTFKGRHLFNRRYEWLFRMNSGLSLLEIIKLNKTDSTLVIIWLWPQWSSQPLLNVILVKQIANKFSNWNFLQILVSNDTSATRNGIGTTPILVTYHTNTFSSLENPTRFTVYNQILRTQCQTDVHGNSYVIDRLIFLLTLDIYNENNKNAWLLDCLSVCTFSDFSPTLSIRRENKNRLAAENSVSLCLFRISKLLVFSGSFCLMKKKLSLFMKLAARYYLPWRTEPNRDGDSLIQMNQILHTGLSHASR